MGMPLVTCDLATPLYREPYLAKEPTHKAKSVSIIVHTYSNSITIRLPGNILNTLVRKIHIVVSQNKISQK